MQRQTQYLTTSGYSEDSAYTSEFNYPVTGQNPGNKPSMGPNTGQQQQSFLGNNFTPGGIPMQQQYGNQYNQQMMYQNQNAYMNDTTRDNSYEYSGYYDDGSGFNNVFNNQVVPDNNLYPDDGVDYDQDELYYNSRPLK